MEEIEYQLDKLVQWVQPTDISEKRRNDVSVFLRERLQEKLGPEAFICLSGSSPLKTYLPDSDLDMVVFMKDSANKGPSDGERNSGSMPSAIYGAPSYQRTWRNPLLEVNQALCDASLSPAEEFRIWNISFINARTNVVSCTVQNISVDITENQMASLGSAALLEEADRNIGGDHLFKRSLLLIKAWCRYESGQWTGPKLHGSNGGGFSSPGPSILGSKVGMLSSYALAVMVLHLFNKTQAGIQHPLHALIRFLRLYSTFDWGQQILRIDGPVPLPAQPGNGVWSSVSALRTRFRPLLERLRGFLPAEPLAGQNFTVRYCNIADPLNPFNNLGYNITRPGLRMMLRALKGGCSHLDHLLTQIPTMINPHLNVLAHCTQGSGSSHNGSPLPGSPPSGDQMPSEWPRSRAASDASPTPSEAPEPLLSSASSGMVAAAVAVVTAASQIPSGHPQMARAGSAPGSSQQGAATLLPGSSMPLPMLPSSVSAYSASGGYMQPSAIPAHMPQTPPLVSSHSHSSAFPLKSIAPPYMMMYAPQPVQVRNQSAMLPPNDANSKQSANKAMAVWFVRSFFPSSMALYGNGDGFRSDLLSHPLQQWTTEFQMEVVEDKQRSSQESDVLDGDVNALWLAISTASQIILPLQESQENETCEQYSGSETFESIQQSDKGDSSGTTGRLNRKPTTPQVQSVGIQVQPTVKDSWCMPIKKDRDKTKNHINDKKMSDIGKLVHNPNKSLSSAKRTSCIHEVGTQCSLLGSTLPQLPHSCVEKAGQLFNGTACHHDPQPTDGLQDSTPLVKRKSKLKRRRSFAHKMCQTCPAPPAPKGAGPPKDDSTKAGAGSVWHSRQLAVCMKVFLRPQPLCIACAILALALLLGRYWGKGGSMWQDLMRFPDWCKHFKEGALGAWPPEMKLDVFEPPPSEERGRSRMVARRHPRKGPPQPQDVPPKTTEWTPSEDKRTAELVPHWVKIGGSISFGKFTSGFGARFLWTRDGKSLPNATKSFYSIPKVSLEHEGLYSCTVFNGTESHIWAEVLLQVCDPPMVRLMTIRQSLRVNQTLALHATVQSPGRPTPEFHWQRNGQPLSGPKAALQNYVVPKVTERDAGTYTCEVYNVAGSVLWEEAVVIVTDY